MSRRGNDRGAYAAAQREHVHNNDNDSDHGDAATTSLTTNNGTPSLIVLRWYLRVSYLNFRLRLWMRDVVVGPVHGVWSGMVQDVRSIASAVLPQRRQVNARADRASVAGATTATARSPVDARQSTVPSSLQPSALAAEKAPRPSSSGCSSRAHPFATASMLRRSLCTDDTRNPFLPHLRPSAACWTLTSRGSGGSATGIYQQREDGSAPPSLASPVNVMQGGAAATTHALPLVREPWIVDRLALGITTSAESMHELAQLASSPPSPTHARRHRPTAALARMHSDPAGTSLHRQHGMTTGLSGSEHMSHVSVAALTDELAALARAQGNTSSSAWMTPQAVDAWARRWAMQWNVSHADTSDFVARVPFLRLARAMSGGDGEDRDVIAPASASASTPTTAEVPAAYQLPWLFFDALLIRSLKQDLIDDDEGFAEARWTGGCISIPDGVPVALGDDIRRIVKCTDVSSTSRGGATRCAVR